MRFAITLLFPAITFAASGWLDWVEPIITPTEKKAYVALAPPERQTFEANFWSNKPVTAEEYFKRIEAIDSKFGSSKRGSGANTDPGRVWLAIGPPASVKRVPSSRVFVPLEIWYYDSIPGVLSTELRLIFYQPNGLGLPRLYTPPLDTIRTLLVPQAATRGLFGPNSVITESDIRKVLRTGPAEDEVISAAVNISHGVTGTGNHEVLARITSPRAMLSRPLTASVKSRFIAARPPLDVFETRSPHGGSQIDLKLITTAQREIAIEVMQGSSAIYRNQLHLGYAHAERVEYTHRLDLLQGTYRVLLTVDGAPFVYPLEASNSGTGEIWRVDLREGGNRETPFQFEGQRLDLNSAGGFAVLALARPGSVQWVIRRGTEIVWRANSIGDTLASIELPKLPPGSHRLEAATHDESRSLELSSTVDQANRPPAATVLSFNANLGPSRRLAFLGRQCLLRGSVQEARRYLTESLNKGVTDDATIGLAQADALLGQLDEARRRVREVLNRNPDNFEALTVFGYIEAQFQDYPAAAELYRRALTVQESPALREALAKLDHVQGAMVTP